MRSLPLTAPAATVGVRGRCSAQLVAASYRPGLIEAGALNAVPTTWRPLTVALRRAVVSMVVLVGGGAVTLWGLWPLLLGVLVVAAGCGLWRARWPCSFERWVARHARAGFRRMWVFAPRWHPAGSR